MIIAVEQTERKTMATPKSADEVFTPNGPPSITYVTRASGGQPLEELLSSGLSTKGALVSISGPSKSGKTVLVERVVGDYLIPVSGAGIHSATELWTRVMAWLGNPVSTQVTTTTGNSSSVRAGAEAGGGFFGIVQGKGNVALSADRNSATAVAAAMPSDPVEQIRKELAGSGFVLFIDDFHYIDRSAQVEIARQLKYLASVDVRLVAASVPFRGDDVVRSNHELQGRLLRVDIPAWSEEELAQIPRQGFLQLGIAVDESSIGRLKVEACGSPQLMQGICLALARSLVTTNSKSADAKDIDNALRLTGLTVDFRNLTKALDQGAKTRGTERKIYELLDGTTGDVYRVVLRAIASDPPRSNFTYQQLLDRVSAICKGEPPTGSSVTGTCAQLKKLADAVAQSQTIEVDWDEDLQVLDLPNPFFLYYLRWSGLLTEPQYRQGVSEAILGRPS